MFIEQFEKIAEEGHAAAIKKIVLVTKGKKALVKKADGPNLDANALANVSSGFKAATGGSNIMGKLKGMIGMGGATNVAPKM